VAAVVLQCKWMHYLLSAVTHGHSWRYCWIILSLWGAKFSCDLDLAVKMKKRNSEFSDFIKIKFYVNAYCNVIYCKQRFSNANRENLFGISCSTK